LLYASTSHGITISCPMTEGEGHFETGMKKSRQIGDSSLDRDRWAL
jgi:hypothetical protein